MLSNVCPPRHELNDRFKSHIKRARRTRIAATSLVCVCLVAGVGIAFAQFAPADLLARVGVGSKHVFQALASAQHNLSAALAFQNERRAYKPILPSQ